MAKEHEGPGAVYRDRWIECTESDLRISGYYFPWGTKRIAYSSIRGLRRVEMGPLTGKGRIWGTASPKYWASFDPGRPRKDVALIINVGKRVQPFVTPDDPDAVEAIIRQRTHLPPGELGIRRNPVV